MSDWTETTLGDIAQVVGGGTPSTSESTYWGGKVLWLTPGELTKHDGRVISSTERTITESGLANSSAKLLPAGTVLLTSRATVGVVGIAGVPIATNQGFQSLIPSLAVLPGFLMRWAQSNRGEFEKRASGSTFPEISGKKVRAIPILLPPLDEQRRIVAVMAAVDAQIEALETEVAATRSVLKIYLENEVSRHAGTKTPIIDLCTKVIGGIWGSPEAESEVDVLALGPRVYSQGTTSVQTTGSPLRSFTTKQVQDRLIREGDIILERSGGSADQPVGRVVISEGDTQPCVPTDFQRLLRPDTEKIVPRFLYWRLQSDWNTRVSVGYSRRTTGITNLSVKDYIARDIVVPSRHDQEMYVAAADSLEAAARATAAELAALRVARAELLTVLLSQEVTADEAVDQFAEAAA